MFAKVYCVERAKNNRQKLIPACFCIASKRYPPESNQELQELFQQIASSSSPDHYKHSVLYYFLKDISQSKAHSSEDFAKTSYLPEKYKTFVDGIWYLDRLKFEVCCCNQVLRLY